MKILSSFLLIIALSFTSCVSKEDRCEQIAFSMARAGMITMNKYRSGKLQKQCIKHYDERGYGKWRSCMLSADDSLEKMKECEVPPFISMVLLND